MLVHSSRRYDVDARSKDSDPETEPDPAREEQKTLLDIPVLLYEETALRIGVGGPTQIPQTDGCYRGVAIRWAQQFADVSGMIGYRTSEDAALFALWITPAGGRLPLLPTMTIGAGERPLPPLPVSGRKPAELRLHVFFPNGPLDLTADAMPLITELLTSAHRFAQLWHLPRLTFVP